MAAAVYFGGNGQLPLAMTGTVLFVILGGVGFELARARLDDLASIPFDRIVG